MLVGYVLWYINTCRLFNANSYLYMYIKYVICKWFLANIFKQTRAHLFAYS